jgi:hypothetical protein
VEVDDVELVGQRLLTRPWRGGDAARVHEIMCHTAMHEFLDLPRPYTRADAELFVTDLGRRDRVAAPDWPARWSSAAVADLSTAPSAMRSVTH